jgi:hypothetical protein
MGVVEVLRQVWSNPQSKGGIQPGTSFAPNRLAGYISSNMN